MCIYIYRIGVEVDFHDMLHRFRVGRGKGNASLKVKLLQHMMAMGEEVLYEVFLEFQNSYDALDLERCMDILVGYGIGPRMERVFRLYWDHLLMVARAGQYYGGPFQ